MEPWKPNPGQQQAFLASNAYEALYGGAAGGGKSDALLMGGTRHLDNPEFSGLFLRRTYPELERYAIPRAHQWYTRLGGQYNDSKHVWRFRSGARMYLGHLEHESDVHEYQSAEFQYIAFDELTSFTETQYVYMLSRLRSTAGIPIRIRAGTNPGGVGHDWVQRRWAPWLGMPPGEEWNGPKAQPNQKLWYVSTAAGEVWPTEDEAQRQLLAWRSAEPLKRLELPLPLQRVFFPARVSDNPYIYEKDPAYVARLMGLDLVTRQQLLHGDWIIRPARGLYFQRGWFRFVDAKPTEGRWVRYWDLAATEAEKGKDPDWTVGVLLNLQDSGPHKGRLTVANCVRMRGNPGDVLKSVKATAELDGKNVPIWMGQDPGQAGVFEISAYTRELAGWNLRGFKETGDKVTRAGPVSAQCEAGNVSIVRAGWNAAFLQSLEEFPEGPHKDDADALSGGYAVLTENPPPSYGDMDSSQISRPWGPQYDRFGSRHGSTARYGRR